MADGENSPADDVRLLGINLTSKPQWAQLLICGGGFFFGYLINGLVEEYVYNRIHFSYGWYFSMVHACYYLLLISLSGFRLKHVQNPWGTYVQMSAVLAGSHGLTKGSLAYLNYPAQLMFKSTKVLPVMMMGSCVPGLRRTYGVRDYTAAVLLVAGLILFTLADASSSPIFSVMGVLMVCGALALDALLGNLQEAIFTINPGTTQMEMLFCSSIVGLPFLLLPCLLTGELAIAFTRCLEHPYIYAVLAFEACATYVGQMAVLSLVILFGAATTAVVTTARKAVTLTLSYMIFSKPFLLRHFIGMSLIACGVGMKMVPSKSKSSGADQDPNGTRYSKVALEDPAVPPGQSQHESVELISQNAESRGQDKV